MNTQLFRSFGSRFCGALLAVVLAVSTPCFANDSSDDLDSILNAPAMPAVNVYQSRDQQNEVFSQANALAARVANIYRDVRYQAYPSEPDASDIKVVCTVTVMDAQSDDVLSTIKTAQRKPSGNFQPITVPLCHVPRNLVSISQKLVRDAALMLINSRDKSVEVMVQIKRNGSSQCTVVVSADNLGGGAFTGVSFISQDDALPNVTDGGYPAN